MATLNPEEAFNKGIKEYLKLDVYDGIMKSYRTIDLSDSKTSANFRRSFNGYYKIRRKPDWWDKYYSIFDEKVNSSVDPTFYDILFKLYIVRRQIVGGGNC